MKKLTDSAKPGSLIAKFIPVTTSLNELFILIICMIFCLVTWLHTMHYNVRFNPFHI